MASLSSSIRSSLMYFLSQQNSLWETKEIYIFVDLFRPNFWLTARGASATTPSPRGPPHTLVVEPRTQRTWARGLNTRLLVDGANDPRSTTRAGQWASRRGIMRVALLHTLRRVAETPDVIRTQDATPAGGSDPKGSRFTFSSACLFVLHELLC